jgi:hypothetical protein
VPLTTSLVGFIFGGAPRHAERRRVFGHRLAAWRLGGGKLFDLQGNYDMMWWISTRSWSRPLHWPIVKPVARPALVAA